MIDMTSQWLWQRAFQSFMSRCCLSQLELQNITHSTVYDERQGGTEHSAEGRERGGEEYSVSGYKRDQKSGRGVV